MHKRIVGLVLIGPVLRLTDGDHASLVKGVCVAARSLSDATIREVVAKRPCLSATEVELLERLGRKLAKDLGTEYKRVVSKGTVWVAMPFARQFDDTYDLAISRAVNELGYDSRRMDRERRPEESMPSILKGIRSSAFVVADLSGGSANVLYEVGYADARKKRVLLISLADDIQKWVRDWQKKGIVPYKLG